MPDVKKKLENVTLFGVKLKWRNFAGRAQQFNEEGNRNFVIVLDDETAARLSMDGWNVKTKLGREEGDAAEYQLQVKVNFKSERPPKIVLITNGKRLQLGPDEVALLDFADLANVDVTLNPYAWEMSGKTGITAYLKTAFITQAVDELDRLYGQTPGEGFGTEDNGPIDLTEYDKVEDDEHAGVLSEPEVLE